MSFSREPASEMTVCAFCGAIFARRQDLDRHVASIHGERKFECGQCGQRLSRKDALQRHQRTCGQRQASRSLSPQPGPSRRHASSPRAESSAAPKRQRRAKGKTYRCRDCNQLFDDITTFINHFRHVHYLPLNRERVDFERPYVWEDDDGNINEQLRDHLTENREFIHADHQLGSVMTRLNFAITARVGEDRWFLEIIRLIEMLRNMSFHNSIRFNMSLGFTLVDSQSGRYRYFLPHHNTPISNNRDSFEIITTGMTYCMHWLSNLSSPTSFTIGRTVAGNRSLSLTCNSVSISRTWWWGMQLFSQTTFVIIDVLWVWWTIVRVVLMPIMPVR